MRYRTICPRLIWDDVAARADLLGLVELLDRQILGVEEFSHLGEVHILSAER